MRIAVVSSPVTALRPAQLGGAQAFICDLARGLTERGHDVTLHCAEGSQVDGVELVTVAAPPDAAAALVMPGGSQPPPAPGVAAALGQIFQTIRAMDVDVISQHAFDAPALELPRGLRVLHTLHLPPIVTGVVEAARQVPAGALATVSRSCQAHWRGAGVDVERVLRNGVADIAIESAPSRSARRPGRGVSPRRVARGGRGRREWVSLRARRRRRPRRRDRALPDARPGVGPGKRAPPLESRRRAGPIRIRVAGGRAMTLTALVTGGSGGIGGEVVKELRARRWDVTSLSRSEGCDVSDEDQVVKAFGQLRSLNALVHCEAVLIEQPF